MSRSQKSWNGHGIAPFFRIARILSSKNWLKSICCGQTSLQSPQWSQVLISLVAHVPSRDNVPGWIVM